MSRIRQLIREAAPAVTTSDTVQEAARRLEKWHCHSLAVCNDGGRFAGIITDHDITRHCVAPGNDPTTMIVNDLPHHPILSIDADDDPVTVLRLMRSRDAHELPVLDNGALLGVIFDTDIVTHLIDGSQLLHGSHLLDDNRLLDDNYLIDLTPVRR